MGTVVRFMDSLRNAITGAGTSRDARMANTYAWRSLTQPEITAAYRGSGLLRKIIGIPPLDMVREWRDWKAEDDQIELIEAEEKRFGLQGKVRTAEVLRGLGGGAMILGLPGDPSQPASDVTQGKLAYIHVVSRWHLTFDGLEEDARLPGYGEPKMWRMNTGAGQIDIHPSRVVAFRADTAATIATYGSVDLIEAYWGESRVAQVIDAVTDCDEARSSFAALLRKIRLTRIGIPNLSGTLSIPGGESKIQARLEMIALAESIHNAAVFDAGSGSDQPGETITDVAYNFAGVKDVLNAYAEFAAAISDIPATRLLGRAPEGMNASGDSQQKDWSKMIRARQMIDLEPCMARLDRFLVPSALGKADPGIWYEWAPLDLPSEKEIADRFKIEMEAIDKLAGLSAMPERAFNRGVQSLMIERGYMPGLEAALGELSDDERYGVEAEPTPMEPVEGGGQPDLAGEGGGRPGQALPSRRAANDAWMIEDWAAKTLYVRRDVLNRDDIVKWARAQGFTDIVPDMHVTIIYSNTPVDWMKMGESWRGKLEIEAGGPRLVEALGPDGKYKALLFTAYELVSRNAEMREKGASFDWPEYQPHISIQIGGDIDLASVKPYTGKIALGPEIFEEIRP